MRRYSSLVTWESSSMNPDDSGAAARLAVYLAGPFLLKAGFSSFWSGVSPVTGKPGRQVCSTADRASKAEGTRA